jgi:hypothetical protein
LTFDSERNVVPAGILVVADHHSIEAMVAKSQTVEVEDKATEQQEVVDDDNHGSPNRHDLKSFELKYNLCPESTVGSPSHSGDQ